VDQAAWERTYERILADFGYSREDDEAARDELATLARHLPRPRLQLDGEVAIAGPRPTPLPDDARVLATDAAGWAFGRAEAIVTDLDGDVEAQLASGAPLFVHAHGDNREALRRWLPRMRGPVQPTTQAAPRDGVENYGGFTDGDRACCIAIAHGATALALAGFDFEEPWPKPEREPETKRRKLAWARRIIEGLGVPVRRVG